MRGMAVLTAVWVCGVFGTIWAVWTIWTVAAAGAGAAGAGGAGGATPAGAAAGPLTGGAASAPGGRRAEVSLSGQWQCALVDELNWPPAAGAKWRAMAVPGYLSGIDYKRAWLRRTFRVPAGMGGMRLAVRFGGVKYNSRVLVNGRRVGGCFGGYDAFEVDVTDAVRPGADNELAVGVHDWTGIFTPGKVTFPDPPDWHQVRAAPRDKILAPIGGLYGLYGIWDDVTLVARPAVCVRDAFVKPSVRRGELAVDYTLANESAADVEVSVSADVADAAPAPGQGAASRAAPATRSAPAAGQSAAPVALRLGPAKVKIPAGKTVAVTLRAAWKSPHVWSPADPHLYELHTRLSTGDALRTRFGFREFWTHGPDFYLNGAKITMLASSWWPPHSPATRDEIARQWRAIKKVGCVAFRTHTQPWPEVYYDLADEIGLLMIPEGAVWNDRDVYRINDPVFWDNYGGHLRAMVERLRNHPSVVMWSLENEFCGGRLNDTALAKADLVRMGRLVKEWDPTRPIFYESDGDPGGVADAIGMHYPHEYPDYTCWPNEAYWLDRPQKPPVGMFLNGEQAFLWRRNKPLYIGEFLWVPSSEPSWNTVFFGDRAYIDYGRYRNLAKAECWKMQILGYRHQGVGGICPWTMIEGGPLDETNVLYEAHRYAFQHLAAYPLDYDRRFYGPGRVGRRVDVYNDIIEPSELTLGWTLDVGGKAVDEGTQTLALDAGERKTVQVDLNMPPASKPTPARWRLTLTRGGKTVFRDEHAYTVWPAARLSAAGAAIGLHDPRGGAGKLFAEQGLAVTPVESLERIDARVDVLVIAPGAFKAARGPAAIGEVPPQQAGLEAFLARGGRVLVLEQDAWPAGLLGLQLTDQRSTMTFALRPSHPALAGLAQDDLKFWRGDHIVSASELVRPMSGAGRAIVVSGSAGGIDHAPLLELPAGKGLAVISQLKLVEKFRTEPAAGRILANLLAYLARRQPAGAKQTLVVGGSRAYLAHLRTLGLRAQAPADASKADLSACGLVVCRGGDALQPAQAAELGRRLREFVAAGGRVLLHRPQGDSGQALLDAMGLGLTLEPGPVTLTRAEGGDPLLGAITREDLYWLGRQESGWAGGVSSRAEAMCDGLVGRTMDAKRAAAYSLRGWRLEGMLVQTQGDGVIFATVGTATGEVDFPADGVYTLGIVASGTPCRGVFPAAGIAVDGRAMGTVHLRGPQPGTYTVWGPVAKGRHKVAVSFLNDASIPGKEDRNLVVQKLLVARCESNDVTALTDPAAAVAVRRGDGVVVVDRVRWDTEAANARKAARYACTLLGELSGDLVCRTGITVQCTDMTPQKGLTLFEKRGGRVYLASNGHISGAIRVAAGGRYTMEVFAGGSPAKGQYAIVEVLLDGRSVARIETAGLDCRPFALTVDLAPGEHDLRLAFVNDLWEGGEDRNAVMEKVVFYRD